MAIKNFKAPLNNAAIEEEKILVIDYMVPLEKLIYFTPKQTVLEVMSILVKHDISGGPVLNEDNELLGMISEGDCMKKIANSRYYNLPVHDQLVEKYMDIYVDTIEEETNIFDVANLFCTAKRNRFPVVKYGKVIGQISRGDVLKAALEIKPQHW